MTEDDAIGLIRTRLRSVVMVQLPDGIGSGFYVSESGLIATSAHVVGNQSSVTIKRFDRSTAKVRVVRVASRYDLALLWDRTASIPAPIPLADPATAASGMIVYAIGHPKGLDFTVTRGIVSAINRIVSDVHYVQTDAAAHPGSSGGPLLDPRGDVLGVSTFGLKVDGLSFALSVRYVRELLGEVVIPAATQSARICESCGARNRASRRMCRRCNAPLAPDPENVRSSELLSKLEPAAAVEKGSGDDHWLVQWKGETFSMRLGEADVRLSIQLADKEAASVVLAEPVDAPKLGTALELLILARERLGQR